MAAAIAIVLALLAASPAQAGRYVVRWGDTLTWIAQAHHVGLNRLARMNHRHPYAVLVAGTVLHVPGRTHSRHARATYTVQWGDTLSAIAAPVPHRPSQPCAGERPAAARPSDLGDVASHPGPRPGSRPCRAPPQPHARPQAHRGRLERPLPRPPRRHADRHRPALRRRPAPARPRERPPRPRPPHHRDAAARAGARDARSPPRPPPPTPRRPGRSAGRSTIGAPTTASTPISSGPSPGRSRGGTPKPSRPPARGASCR